MFSTALSYLSRAAAPLLLPGEPEEDLAFLRLLAALSALALAVYDASPQQVGTVVHFHVPVQPGQGAPETAAAVPVAGAAFASEVAPTAGGQALAGAAAGNAAPLPLQQHEQQGGPPALPPPLARVAARLVHLVQPPTPAAPTAAGGGCTAGAAASKQQLGVWEVEGLGLVVAFRGTAALDDVTLNANIQPQPLPLDPRLQRRGVCLQLHGGFLQGVLPHTAALAAVLRRRRARPGCEGQRLWLTGHSLGGALAAALALVLMADASLHDLLAQGGGVVTFGAPMIAYDTQPASLYAHLASLADWARASAGQELCFHNVVHGMDMVPRLLGSAMGRVHNLLEARLPSLAPVRAIADNYHGFGQYHLLLGGALRTLPQERQEGDAGQEQQQQQLPQLQQGQRRRKRASPEGMPSLQQQQQQQQQGSLGECQCRGRFGSLSYAQQVAAQLEVTGVWKAALLAGGDAGMLSDHSMELYKAQICSHMERVAAAAHGSGGSGQAVAAPPSMAAEGILAAPGQQQQQQENLGLERGVEHQGLQQLDRACSSASGGSGSGSGRQGSRSWGPNRRSPSLDHKAALFARGEASTIGGNQQQPGVGSSGAAAGGSSSGMAAGGWEATVLQKADHALEVANRWLAAWAQEPQAPAPAEPAP
ncbi:hypothetical protein N2152v2_001799 [Parachlorella kessleri]